MKSKKKYLYQLMITVVILILVPTAIFCVFFLERSVNELRENNKKYYENVCRTFAGRFIEEIWGFNTMMVRFAENSRDIKNNESILYKGSRKIAENPYYYSEAAKMVSEHGLSIGKQNFGVYYYETNTVLYKECKYSAEQMIMYHFEGDEQTAEFFLKENYEDSKILFAPVCDRNGEYQKLWVGVCTKLGQDREEVLCFYSIEPEDMSVFWQSAQSRCWEKYYVMDNEENRIIYGISNEVISRGTGNFLEELQKADAEDYNLYSISNSRHGLTFILDTSGDEEQNSVYIFYTTMRKYVVCVVFLLVLLAILMVWYNYRPIHALMKLVGTKGENEFDSFFNYWEQQNLRLTDQRVMIMDLLLNHLLYGHPVPQKCVGMLDIEEKFNKYCVFILEKHVFLSGESVAITQCLEQKFNCNVFITDLVGENSTIIMAFMEKDQTGEIGEWLKSWCKEHVSSEWILHCGTVVDNLNDMQYSFAEYKRQKKRKKEHILDVENVRREEENYEILKTNILAYLDENYMDTGLSQVSVADYFNISVYSMSRIFKNQFGIGFVDYINGKRMERAMQLLKTTEIPVQNIAIEVGFSDANYFSKVFKKYVGSSPSKYRED